MGQSCQASVVSSITIALSLASVSRHASQSVCLSVLFLGGEKTGKCEEMNYDKSKRISKESGKSGHQPEEAEGEPPSHLQPTDRDREPHVYLLLCMIGGDR